MATIIRDGRSYARNVSDLKIFVTAKQTKLTIQAPSDNEFEAPSQKPNIEPETSDNECENPSEKSNIEPEISGPVHFSAY